MSAETPLRHTSEDDALVRALHAAHDDGPSEAELRALEAAVLGAIQGGGGGGGGGTPASPKTSLPKASPWTPWTSVAFVGAVAGAIVVGARWMDSQGVPETPPVSAPVEAPRASTAVLEEPIPEPTTGPTAEPIPEAVEPSVEVVQEPSRVSRPRVEEEASPVESAPLPRAPDVESEDETVLLRRASSSLQARPLEALALTERMARVAQPEWAEERERVAIEALVRLSRRGEAEARFASFSQAYPHSAYGVRLRSLLSEGP